MNGISTNELQTITSTYKRQFIEDILNGMEHFLDNNQLSELNKSLNNNTNNLTFADNPENYDLNWEKTNEILIKEFLKAKKTKGLSNKTIVVYSYSLDVLKEWCIKSFLELTSEDLKEFLSFYQSRDNCSLTTLNNQRRHLSSFFRFLTDEEKILINPMLRIPAFKEPKIIKKAFTYEEIEKMRHYLEEHMYLKYHGELSVRTVRTRAMFELFLSSGIRVSELATLKLENVNFDECKAIVLGKGNKERVIYFSEKAKRYMLDYLGVKKKEHTYLFTSLQTNRELNSTSIEKVFRTLGEKSGVQCHCHKFRRTFASLMIKKGMPIDQVQSLMGHESIETTLRYIDMDDETIAMTHKKYTNF